MSNQNQPYNPYNWKMILLSQTSIVIISFVLSLYSQYFLPVYIAYLIIYFIIMTTIMARSNPMLSERKYLSEIVNARTILEEKKAGELIQNDEEYIKKFQAITSANLKSFGIMFVYLIVILIFYNFVVLRYVSSVTQIQKLIVFLVYSEALFLFGMFVNRRIMRVQMMEVMAPFTYKITEKGIVSTDRSAVFLHSRHLVNASIVENRDKKYVEISPTTLKLPYKLRLYSNDIDRILDAINRVKRLELKRQQSSSS
ncbi:DUF2208 domain-containing protein [Sulfolobus acidocaldarius]|uniref:Conserved Crenarchaeal protein n=4 Tax=Sulfolobus acidocaldarius TaxID=2285 RepID=Q4JAI8_SULAC|nr:DUF2208 domain-containing protein [Sulfolobus acidocaldarius]AAY80191.1 conserved Crenarchaeal protein [Sulfolobus acidocaldarius DSM 639]AGE70770.1 hypothetical protein SacN8_03995 [Sulfolobus acidocaldarius N8]AGE73041.1 hypothetical protein SacRon12I_03985 [Sulfolobus acidocaldarius Ron12/I]ALU28904.1 hypothetical protein ATY89_02290 [Sulfolobus acidocaldarius]ALU31629.1 hypothetical protein ATZ20_05325 [Sulfolobus acidocaldarius]